MPLLSPSLSHRARPRAWQAPSGAAAPQMQPPQQQPPPQQMLALTAPAPAAAHAPVPGANSPTEAAREGGAAEGFGGLQDLQPAQQQPSTAASDTASEHSLPDDDTRDPLPGGEPAASDATLEAAPTKEEPA